MERLSRVPMGTCSPWKAGLTVEIVAALSLALFQDVTVPAPVFDEHPEADYRVGFTLTKRTVDVQDPESGNCVGYTIAKPSLGTYDCVYCGGLGIITDPAGAHNSLRPVPSQPSGLGEPVGARTISK